MSNVLEEPFVKEARKKLDKIDSLFYLMKDSAGTGHNGKRGYPDIIICYKGRFVGWEMKKSRAEAQETTGRIVMQKHIGSRITEAGGRFWLVYPENFDQVLYELMAIEDNRFDFYGTKP